MHKSTADVEGGRALYEGYSAVTADGTHNFLLLRETILLRKEARKMFVQANTFIKGSCSSSFLVTNTATHIQKFIKCCCLCCRWRCGAGWVWRQRCRAHPVLRRTLLRRCREGRGPAAGNDLHGLVLLVLRGHSAVGNILSDKYSPHWVTATFRNEQKAAECTRKGLVMIIKPFTRRRKEEEPHTQM